jgi:hypothetical protein
LERYSKLIKVDVKTVSDHPYPWHSGSPETAPGGSTKPKNSNRVAAPKSKIGCFKTKQETLVLVRIKSKD